MAKPQLPAKAWLLDSFYDWWLDCHGEDFGYRWINTTDVIWHDVNVYGEAIWCCKILLATHEDGSKQCVSFSAPRYSLEFIPPHMVENEIAPPVCEHCNGTGYLNVGGYPHVLPCLKCQE